VRRLDKRLAGLAAILLACAAGCTSSTRFVELAYPPEEAVKRAAADIPLPETGPRTATVVLAVNDGRESVDRIGTVDGAFGIPRNSILTENNVAVWVRDAIATELERREYRAIGAHGAPASLDRLSVDVVSVFCRVSFFYTASMQLRATLDTIDADPVVVDVPAAVRSGMNFMQSGEGIRETLARVLQQAVLDLLDRYGYLEATAARPAPAARSLSPGLVHAHARLPGPAPAARLQSSRL